MKSFLIVVITITVLGYTILYWDYHLSKYLFKHYCEEEGRVGLFIYEKVALPDEYYMPFPEDKDPRDLDSRFIVGENKMINRGRFEQDYIFTIYQHNPISRFGPIESVESSVTRKSDNKVLSKTVSIKNHKGWWVSVYSFGYASESCPSTRRKSGLIVSEYTKLHETIIHKTFN